jgi:Dyp-type peroxidase family
MAGTAAEEPVLAMGDIQGNVIPGFTKDHVQLLFLRIDEAVAARRWIWRISKVVATAQEVWDFNQLFKRIKERRGFEGSVKSTWINIAFSYRGLSYLVPADVDQFADETFRRSAIGAGVDWINGGDETEPDIVLIVAADDMLDVAAAVQSVKDAIRAPGPTAGGVHVIFEQCGEARGGDMIGHEHFGWLDGVSQPGIRGFVSEEPVEPFTPRENPADLNQGLPGQDVLWPGEFIFGYKGQDPSDATTPGPDSLRPHGKLVAPEWAKNGSYLVFRRLRQDVGAFHRFLHDKGDDLGVDPDALGARLVGRWRSGAPVIRAPEHDDPDVANDPRTRNYFEYGEPRLGEPPVPRDPPGLLCPFSAHIRKAYPRDETAAGDPNPYRDLGETLNESDTQTHRLLRRGIPYGPSSESTPDAPVDDAIDRGLLFMAYMTSISRQFEFVSHRFLNDPDFKSPSTGVDPILGHTDKEATTRPIRTVLPGRKRRMEIELANWVTTTGGGYFFTPSIHGLKRLSGT